MDVMQGNIEDFGLKIALTDNSFFQEFSSFIEESDVSLHHYPLLYDFVKNKIWYIIVHQQQVEGLFNKWDLKTHPNMAHSTQQSKIHIVGIDIKEVQLNNEQLKDIRSGNRSKQNLATLNTELDEQEQTADNLFKDLFLSR